MPCIMSIENKNSISLLIWSVVPLTGLEPVLNLFRWILSPLCLPIPSQRHIGRYKMVGRTGERTLDENLNQEHWKRLINQGFGRNRR